MTRLRPGHYREYWKLRAKGVPAQAALNAVKVLYPEVSWLVVLVQLFFVAVVAGGICVGLYHLGFEVYEALLNRPYTASGNAVARANLSIDVGGTPVVLWGVYVPRAGQACWDENGKAYDCMKEAQEELAALLSKGGSRLSCRSRFTRLMDFRLSRESGMDFALNKDEAGRLVAICQSAQGDIANALVGKGWAVVAVDRHDWLWDEHLTRPYLESQLQAKVSKAGLWRGRFDMPN
jgi:endonuclease YncB( thermonuclease family)